MSVKPVHRLRNPNFKPTPFSRFAIFRDRDHGDCEDLLDKEETQPGILAEPFFENFLFIFERDTDPVIFVDQNQPVLILMVCAPDSGEFFTIPQGVVNKVIEDLLKEGVCIDFDGLFTRFYLD